MGWMGKVVVGGGGDGGVCVLTHTCTCAFVSNLHKIANGTGIISYQEAYR